MLINDPAILAEITAIFDAYEAALTANDIAALDGFFWDSAEVVRFGSGENLYGIAAIRAFRQGRATGDLARTLSNTRITCFGRDLAITTTEFRRDGSGRTGRQSQTWVRLPVGWRIVSAHVSFL